MNKYFFDTNYFQLLMGLRSFQKLEFYKSIIFIFPVKKIIPNWKRKLIFMQLLFFNNKIKNQLLHINTSKISLLLGEWEEENTLKL